MNVEDELQQIKRGTVSIYTEEELLKKLQASKREGKPLNVKLGIDPTMPEIHLGHTVLIRKLSLFQQLGHTVILIIGDFTARIGDPSGRDRTRPPLSVSQIEKNKSALLDSLQSIIDINKITIRYNSEWLSKISLEELIKIAANLTIAKLLEREDFKVRYKNNISITLNEFLYPILQAYDSVQIKADIELGGQDQTYNLLLGRDLQEMFGQQPQVCVTMPLLVGLDGEKKMSKTYKNTIAVKDPPFEMFGKVMSIPDKLMEHYFLLLTDIEPQRIKILCDPAQTHPKIAKEELSTAIVTSFYGREAALQARTQFEKIFSQKEIPSEIPQFVIDKNLYPEQVKIVEIMVKSKLCQSNSQAKTLIRQGAVELNGQKILDISATVKPPGEYILQVGKKKRFLKIVWQ